MSFNCARPITLMQPERLVFPPGWVGHIPFAFWIVEAMRPHRFVELGTHTGNSFGAFVQAADALALQGRFYAVDHWYGDQHAGTYEEAIYLEVNRYFNNRYPDITELLRMSFDEAAPQFEDGSIDLLHIDGFHTYEAVRHDFETWLPKMSERGIVLLHDTQVREGNFGVFRLMEELSLRFSTFEFTHSHGLGVIQTGKAAPEAIKGLASGKADKNGIAAQDYFAQLGNALVGQVYAEVLSETAVERLPFETRLGRANLHKQQIEAENRYLRSEQAKLVAEKDRLATEKWSHEGLLILAGEHLADSAQGVGATIRRAIGKAPTDGASGKQEPSPFFDPAYYLASNPDVAASGMDPLVHYLLTGRVEGRSPTPPPEAAKHPAPPLQARQATEK